MIRVGTRSTAHVWRLEDNSVALASSGDPARVARLVSQHLYPLGHLTGSITVICSYEHLAIIVITADTPSA